MVNPVRADVRRGDPKEPRVHKMRAFTRWKWHLDEVYVKINGCDTLAE